MRILIVEDDRLAAMCMQKMLERLGHDNINVAFSGEQALELAKEHKPDLVLMDVGLPGIDGVETIERMNNCSGGFVVAYVSAYSDEKTMKRAKKTNPIRYISKPIDEGEINTVMEKVLALKK